MTTHSYLSIHIIHPIITIIVNQPLEQLKRGTNKRIYRRAQTFSKKQEIFNLIITTITHTYMCTLQKDYHY